MLGGRLTQHGSRHTGNRNDDENGWYNNNNTTRKSTRETVRKRRSLFAEQEAARRNIRTRGNCTQALHARPAVAVRLLYESRAAASHGRRHIGLQNKAP